MKACVDALANACRAAPLVGALLLMSNPIGRLLE